jgi:hypothetical protein
MKAGIQDKSKGGGKKERKDLNIHIMMFTQVTQISVQLFHSLFVGFDSFPFETFIEL